jgi:hypothetical protein
LAGAVIAGGADGGGGTGGRGGETVCGAGGGGFGAMSASRFSSSRLRRQSRFREIDIEVQDAERQCLSICTRCRPTLNDTEPASAEDVSMISTARKPSRFIEVLPLVMRQASRQEPLRNVI